MWVFGLEINVCRIRFLFMYVIFVLKESDE